MAPSRQRWPLPGATSFCRDAYLHRVLLPVIDQGNRLERLLDTIDRHPPLTARATVTGAGPVSYTHLTLPTTILV